MNRDQRMPKRLLLYHPNVAVDRIRQQWDDLANPNYRWYISIPFRGRPTRQRAAVVMLNPSWTDAVHCDQTVYSVQCRVFDSLPSIEWIDIVNLWAYRGVNPQVLADALDRGDFSVIHHPQNDVWIQRVVSGAEIVLVGWGGPPRHKAVIELRYLERLSRVKAIMEECGKPARAVVESATGYPYHGRHWFRKCAKASSLPLYSWKVLDRIPQLRQAVLDAPDRAR